MENSNPQEVKPHCRSRCPNRDPGPNMGREVLFRVCASEYLGLAGVLQIAPGKQPSIPDQIWMSLTAILERPGSTKQLRMPGDAESSRLRRCRETRSWIPGVLAVQTIPSRHSCSSIYLWAGQSVDYGLYNTLLRPVPKLAYGTKNSPKNFATVAKSCYASFHLPYYNTSKIY
jgi:hypothetical protein